MIYQVIHNAHPDVFWYCLKGMVIQKKVLKKVFVTVFPFIFHIKTEWNIVYEYSKTKTFQETQTSFPKCIEHQIILETTTIGGFWVSLNYPILNFKKTVMSKKLFNYERVISLLPLLMDEFQLPQGYSHHVETVYFLPVYFLPLSLGLTLLYIYYSLKWNNILGSVLLLLL